MNIQLFLKKLGFIYKNKSFGKDVNCLQWQCTTKHRIMLLYIDCNYLLICKIVILRLLETVDCCIVISNVQHVNNITINLFILFGGISQHKTYHF